MRFVVLDETNQTQVLVVPDINDRKHQVQVELSGSPTGSITVKGKVMGATTFSSLGVIDTSECPAIKVFDGVYSEIQFVPSSSFSYSVSYTGWA